MKRWFQLIVRHFVYCLTTIDPWWWDIRIPKLSLHAPALEPVFCYKAWVDEPRVVKPLRACRHSEK